MRERGQSVTPPVPARPRPPHNTRLSFVLPCSTRMWATTSFTALCTLGAARSFSNSFDTFMITALAVNWTSNNDDYCDTYIENQCLEVKRGIFKLLFVSRSLVSLINMILMRMKLLQLHPWHKFEEFHGTNTSTLIINCSYIYPTTECRQITVVPTKTTCLECGGYNLA